MWRDAAPQTSGGPLADLNQGFRRPRKTFDPAEADQARLRPGRVSKQEFTPLSRCNQDAGTLTQPRRTWSEGFPGPPHRPVERAGRRTRR